MARNIFLLVVLVLALLSAACGAKVEASVEAAVEASVSSAESKSDCQAKLDATWQYTSEQAKTEHLIRVRKTCRKAGEEDAWDEEFGPLPQRKRCGMPGSATVLRPV